MQPKPTVLAYSLPHPMTHALAQQLDDDFLPTEIHWLRDRPLWAILAFSNSKALLDARDKALRQGRRVHFVEIDQLLVQALAIDWYRIDEGVCESTLGRPIGEMREIWEDEKAGQNEEAEAPGKGPSAAVRQEGLPPTNPSFNPPKGPRSMAPQRNPARPANINQTPSDPPRQPKNFLPTSSTDAPRREHTIVWNNGQTRQQLRHWRDRHPAERIGISHLAPAFALGNNEFRNKIRLLPDVDVNRIKTIVFYRYFQERGAPVEFGADFVFESSHDKFEFARKWMSWLTDLLPSHKRKRSAQGEGWYLPAF